MSFWQQSFGVQATNNENDNAHQQTHEESDDNMITNDSFWDDDAYDDGDFGDGWGKNVDESFPSSAADEQEEIPQQHYEANVSLDNVSSQFSAVEQDDHTPNPPPQVSPSHQNGNGGVLVPEGFNGELSDDGEALVEYSDNVNQQQEEGILTSNGFSSPFGGYENKPQERPKETIRGDYNGYLTQRTEYNQLAIMPSYDGSFIMTPTKQDKHHHSQQHFVFLSDQKAMPSELKRLQEKTRRRRRDISNQFHKLELQIASAASSFAEEKMDLGLAIGDTFERSCCQPLEEAAERIVMERETVMDRRPAVSSMEKRLSKLSVDMTRHVHVEMNDAKRNELDSFGRDLMHEIIPSLRIEKSMADKIEGSIVRRYETSAGLASKNFHQECATRKAELELFHRKMKRELQTQEQHSEDILDVIRDLRRQLRMEREERKAADKKLMEEITRTSIAMRRAFLAAFDDSNTK